MKDLTSNPLTIVHRLPHEVLVYVKKHYPNGTILDLEQDVTHSGELKYYDIDVVDADNTYHVRFDKQGKFVHEETEVGKIDTSESAGDPNAMETKEPSVNDEALEEF